MSFQTFGPTTFLKLLKTAFLCSRKVPAEVVLKSYDWAKEQRKNGTCVICGNHSQIEKDVFEILLKGNQPLILVLARGMKKRWEPEIRKAIAENRLMVISPFSEKDKRVTRDKAAIRNKLIIELADHIVVGYVSEGGQLEQLLLGSEVKYSLV